MQRIKELFSFTGLSPSMTTLSRDVQLIILILSGRTGNIYPTTPYSYRIRFGLLPFRSPLLRESLLFYFPPLTKMFHFSGFTLDPQQIKYLRLSPRWVSPFGNPRVKGCLPPNRGLSQARNVLHRLDIPRHPPLAYKCVLASN